MFEAAELGHTLDKKTYEAEIGPLRAALLEAQSAILKESKFPVILVIGGVDGAGKGETVNLLNAWMDPRYIATWAMGLPTPEEEERPPYWRYWRALPPKGKIGIFFGSWHSWPILQRAYRQIDGATMDQRLEESVRFEKMLTDEGALIIKLWFHLSKKQQKKRLKALEDDKRTRWRVTPQDWKHFDLYDRFRKVSEHALLRTSTGNAPWIVVEGANARYRSLTVGKALLDAFQQRLAGEGAPSQTNVATPILPPIDGKNLLATLDLSQSVSEDKYDDEFEKLQGRLNLATRHPKFKKISVLAVFEGADAAGKGGAIRRITGALDARTYRVIPIAAPTEEERAQPYLWRFWRHLPGRGHIAIFDRSWYGRVLVERVEKFCHEVDWLRAYSEINDFEEQVHHHQTVVVKFWLHIDQEEQLRRFTRRQETDFMQHKITAEDWRNRAKWGDYEIAASDMIERTSVEHAQWTIVEANDKLFARLKVLRTLCEAIENALDKVR
jgi:polyphosphate:AMP phosphotransferase